MNILTYNIRAGRGIDNFRSLDRVAGELLRWNADIICLQEVEQWEPGHGYGDQPTLLSKALSMNALFHGVLPLAHYNYGIALLTKLPITKINTYLLPSEDEQRGLIHAQVASEGGVISVFCTHLGLGSAERVNQATFISGIMNAVAGPKVICGDFNETSDKQAVKTLIKKSGLCDMATELGSEEFTFPADTPTHRIDYILATKDVKAEAIRVMESPASDHRPILASGITITV